VIRTGKHGITSSAFLIAALIVPATTAEAGRLFGRRPRTVVPTATVRPADVQPSPMLGNFYPEPYMYVRNNGASGGGGYAPGGLYGSENALSLYGPFSSLRATTAPLVVYSRGYNGVVQPVPATSFSTPFLPEATPVIYPTRANIYGGFRQSRTPPWWPNGINFVDLN
jgi:hypothetical protein